MNHLLRELAPLSDAAWAEIDDEATRTLTHFYAARKLVDFDGPLGYAASAVGLGRLEPVGDQPPGAVTANRRQLLPLLELRRQFTLQRSETESIDRGACNADLDPLIDACREVAFAEDTLVFAGNASAGIVGIVEASPHAAITLTDEFERYPNWVAQAVAVLKDAGMAVRTRSPSGRAATPASSRRRRRAASRCSNTSR